MSWWSSFKWELNSSYSIRSFWIRAGLLLSLLHKISRLMGILARLDFFSAGLPELVLALAKSDTSSRRKAPTVVGDTCKAFAMARSLHSGCNWRASLTVPCRLFRLESRFSFSCKARRSWRGSGFSSRCRWRVLRWRIIFLPMVGKLCLHPSRSNFFCQTVTCLYRDWNRQNNLPAQSLITDCMNLLLPAYIM